nr:MAG TPA: hypothetical protein [Caudoviricetes sp.]
MFVQLPNEQAEFQIHFLFAEKYQLLYCEKSQTCF